MSVENYIAYLRKNGKNESVLKRIEPRLKKNVEFFTNNGIEHPTEADYKALKEYMNSLSTAKNVITELEKNTKDFYAWRNQQKTPVENEAIEAEAEKVIEPVSNTAMSEKKIAEPVKPDEEQQTKQRGRKTYDSSGEKRTVKFTVYLTPTISEDVQDLARIKRKTVADYIASLIYEDCEKEAERIAKFRELSKA